MHIKEQIDYLKFYADRQKIEIGHPDRILNTSKSSEETSDEEDEESEEESRSKDGIAMEREENFLIESDNINDKLYSSETEDDDNIQKLQTNKSNGKNERFSGGIERPKVSSKTEDSVPKNRKQQLNISSESTASSSEEKSELQPTKSGRNINTSGQRKTMTSNSTNNSRQNKTLALNLHSDSESHGRGVEEFDVSGPENELGEDDFWN